MFINIPPEFVSEIRAYFTERMSQAILSKVRIFFFADFDVFANLVILALLWDIPRVRRNGIRFRTNRIRGISAMAGKLREGVRDAQEKFCEFVKKTRFVD